jgi:hypothetical protein
MNYDPTVPKLHVSINILMKKSGFVKNEIPAIWSE